MTCNFTHTDFITYCTLNVKKYIHQSNHIHKCDIIYIVKNLTRKSYTLKAGKINILHLKTVFLRNLCEVICNEKYVI